MAIRIVPGRSLRSETVLNLLIHGCPSFRAEVLTYQCVALIFPSRCGGLIRPWPPREALLDCCMILDRNGGR